MHDTTMLTVAHRQLARKHIRVPMTNCAGILEATHASLPVMIEREKLGVQVPEISAITIEGGVLRRVHYLVVT